MTQNRMSAHHNVETASYLVQISHMSVWQMHVVFIALGGAGTDPFPERLLGVHQIGKERRVTRDYGQLDKTSSQQRLKPPHGKHHLYEVGRRT